VHARDVRGTTALQAAAANGHLHVLRQLLAAGADLEHTDKAGYTVVHYAAHSGSSACIRALQTEKADLDAGVVGYGWTPLHQAVNSSHPQAVRALLRFGARANIQDALGWTPLHVATHQLGLGTNGCSCKDCVRRHADRVKTLRLLVRGGVRRDLLDQHGAAAVHLAAAHDCAEALPHLRGGRAEVWQPDKRGNTPLALARRRSRPSRFVRALLLLREVEVANGE